MNDTLDRTGTLGVSNVEAMSARSKMVTYPTRQTNSRQIIKPQGLADTEIRKARGTRSDRDCGFTRPSRKCVTRCRRKVHQVL